MRFKLQNLILLGLIFAYVLGISLQCSQKENRSYFSSRAISDTSRISASELSLLPAKGPYFPVDERIIEDRWMIERFVVQLKKRPDNPVMVKELSWEGTGPLAGGSVMFDPEDKIFKMSVR